MKVKDKSGGNRVNGYGVKRITSIDVLKYKCIDVPNEAG